MEQSLRKLVWSRASETCEYCCMPQAFDDLPFQIDHIIAEKHDGATIDDNLALACFYDNACKGSNIAGLDPDSGKLTALFHPRQNAWSEHFMWAGAVIVPRSPIGRTTIQVLRLNTEKRVALRQSLIDEGVFPPHVG